MLYPSESESREVKDLSGLWNFKVDALDQGLISEWYRKGLPEPECMPVPASYNDIVKDQSGRDHIGTVWYERPFFVPKSWEGQRVFIRVGAAAHHSTAWVNGTFKTRHKGGFLPFSFDISSDVRYGAENRVTISVNNVLDWTCLPPGEVVQYQDGQHPAGCKAQIYHFDFFNYSGIHRPVKLFCLPQNYISDINVTTRINGNKAFAAYQIQVEGLLSNAEVVLKDAQGKVVAGNKGLTGELTVNDPHLWEAGNAYLYKLEARLIDKDGKTADSYPLNVGIRTVEIKGGRFLINGKPFYFQGFGMHEDSDIRGKGMDYPLLANDFRLLKWTGANSVRTSHYPYSEEFMDFADREGIVVIDEVPAVGMNIWGTGEPVFCEERVNQKTLEHHIDVVRDLIGRDKNHPSVVLWSVVNEAATYEPAALPYFEKVVEAARSADPTRPVTGVNSTVPEKCTISHLFDIICVNRYYSWYSDPGRLDVIPFQLEKELLSWHKLFNKPVLLTEYGADAVAGLHDLPSQMFSEEYQCELLTQYHQVLDKLDFIIGEHVWNFADFATKQGIARVGGNKKGVFTRARKPKAAAHMLRERWRTPR